MNKEEIYIQNPRIELIKFFVMILIIVGLITGCSINGKSSSSIEEKAYYPQTFIDACGSEVLIQKEPQNVVVQGSWEEEFLKEVGAGGKVKRFEGKGVGGSINETERRIVAETNPDVVIIMSKYKPTEGDCKSANALQKMGVPAYVSDQSTVKKVASELLQIGNMINTKEQAKRASEKLSETIRKVEQAVYGLNRKTVYWENGLNVEFEEIKNFIAIGGSVFEDDLLKLVGGENIIKNPTILNPYRVETDLKDIQDKNPECIIVSEHEIKFVQGYQPVKLRDGWESIAAIKNNNIIELPMSFGSISSLSADIIQLAEFIHPELAGTL
ncbi:ABC transporter substrate-binding protein [Paenibacillus chitinolyticus]|uniref:ABC transporter substrate-binding protein n=1 Tax=Paenibacillus chitinolyticus TaxID=79263 RepID=UPI0036447EDD